ncbi:MAG: DUF3298 and DUF4163 domain-containing protein [Treponema sp.]|nr:DUF3298 and DUF4163 domain-containing protein [Treponema sp.]
MKSLKIPRLTFTILIPFLLISCASLPKTEKKESPKKSNSYTIVKINENLDYLSTKIEYPDFASYPELSKRIKNTVESEWKSFRSYSQAGWTEINNLNNGDSGKTYPPFEYFNSFQVSESGNIISVLLNTYLFSGGAHGNTTLTALNYDTVSGKFLNILEVSSLTYNEISEICRNSLYKTLIDNNDSVSTASEIVDMKEMINTGAFPQAGNFEIFTIKGKKLTVYFEPYSVAPYVYGIQSVEITIK